MPWAGESTEAESLHIPYYRKVLDFWLARNAVAEKNLQTLYNFLLSQFFDTQRLVINYLLEDNISIAIHCKYRCRCPRLIRHCLRNAEAHCCSLLVLAVLVFILHKNSWRPFQKTSPHFKKEGGKGYKIRPYENKSKWERKRPWSGRAMLLFLISSALQHWEIFLVLMSG